MIGVAREGFFGVEPGKFVDVWTPAATADRQSFESPGWNWFFIIGRLHKGTPEGLAAQLQPAYHRQQQDIIKSYSTMPEGIRKQFLNRKIQVRPAAFGTSEFQRTFERPMWVVLAVAVCLMLISCANLASLLLARGTARAAEMAMRTSLGASRARLLRQMLTESLVLATSAGVLGWLLARGLAPVLVGALATEDQPLHFALYLDTRVLLFCILISTLAALLFGSIPAWQSSNAKPAITLRSNSGQASKLRLGRLFVSAQVAGAFCLVTVGAAFLFSLIHLLNTNKGFVSQDVTVLDIAAERKEDARQLRQALAERSGIEGAAGAIWAILIQNAWVDQIILPGQSMPEQQELFYQSRQVTSQRSKHRCSPVVILRFTIHRKWSRCLALSA